MRSVRIFLGIALAVAGLSLPGLAESRRLQSGSGHHDKFSFYYDTHLDPAGPELSNLGGGILVDEVFHRFMVDSSRRVYFGYDAIVEPLKEAGTYRVSFKPLSLMADALRATIGGDSAAWTQLQTPGWEGQSSQVLRKGEVLALTLLTNSATGQKIIDYVTIQEPARPPVGFDTLNTPVRGFAFAGGIPRDFRADDAELRIEAPRMSINGKVDTTATGLNIDVAGRIVWFYAPNRGRFLMSLSPQKELGFRNAGEVRGSTLTFKSGNDTFNIVAGAPIAPGHAPFNLYVLHEPAWKPDYGFAAATYGAFERADLPIRK